MPKPSPQRIQAVLKELYTLDPSLRAHGPALEQAVTTLLSARPDIRINATFAATLRTQLKERVATPHTTPFSSFMKNISPRLWIPATAVIAVAVAVIVTQPYGFNFLPTQQKSANTTQPSDTVSIAYVDALAFGELSGATGAAGLGSGPETVSMRSQSGGGGGGGSMPAIAPLAGMGDAKANAYDTSATSLIAPEEYIYERPRYTYTGELEELPAQGTVYRRVKNPITGIGSTLANAQLGFLDLGRFANSQLTQFTLTQPGPYGYMLYVDLKEGSVSINQDWATWPQATTRMYEPLAATDVPDDSALIAIADQFLQEHGIAKNAYAAPVVDRRWSIVQPYMKGTEAVTEDLKIRWAPETMTVLYPLELDGLIAYDESGFPYGLSVSVNIRDNRVNNVWNLTTLNYEASAYDLVTDAETLLDIASRGDQYSGPFGQDPQERIREMSLGAPTQVLMQTWRATETGNGEELLVPALRFPILPDSEGNTDYREAVMVPLVKGLTEPIYRTLESSAGSAAVSDAAEPPIAQPAPDAAR